MSLSLLHGTSSVTIVLSLALVSGCSDASEVDSALNARDRYDEEAHVLTEEQGDLREALERLNSQLEGAKSKHALLQEQLDGEAALLARLKSSIEGDEGVQAEGGKR